MSALNRVIRNSNKSNPDVAAAISEIVALDEYCQSLYQAAIEDEADPECDEVWERVFDAVFNSEVSQKVLRLSRNIPGTAFDWYDPDTTYEEDATAFINALNDYAGRIG